MQPGTINGQPYELPEGYEPIAVEDRRRLQKAARLLSDLDRSSYGRHKGDCESQDPTGWSQGNPLLPPGTHVGYTMDGEPIVVPERPGDPEAWTRGR